MDSCTDAYNITDCLLQAVLEAVKDHNRWDAPTLAVTAVIGIVALTFAAMTVLQGVLSAGPGHRKCSKGAIGYWGSKTTRRWNWSEFRRDSFAHTPVITSSMRGVTTWWRREMEDLGEMRREEVYPDKADGYTVWKQKKQTSTDFPATWLNLLKYIDMDDFVWYRFQNQTKRTAADYLPSEVQAVPAFIDVDSIIVLAALAGCDTLTIKSEFGYPLITGATIQVHFRRDPFLGVVASFERYGSERSNEEEQSEREQSEGEQSKKVKKSRRHRRLFRDNKNPQPLKNYGEFQAQLWLFEAMSFGVPARYIDFEAKILHPLPCRVDFGHDQTKLLRLLERPSLSWLLYASPLDLIKIFPAKSAMIEPLLGTIVVQGAYWPKSHLAKQDVATRLRHDIPYVGNWNEFWRQIVRVEFMRHKLRSPWLLLALCLEFTVNVRVGQKEFRRLPQYLKDLFRGEIRKEMEHIDDKIFNDRIHQQVQQGMTPQCARVEMYIRSAALIDLEPFRKLLVRRQVDEELEHSQIQFIKSEPGFEAAGDLLIAIHKWETSHLPEAEDVSPKETPRIFGQVFQRMMAGDLELIYQSLSNLASQFNESIDLALSPISPSVIDPIESVTEQHNPIELMMEQQDPVRELLIYRTVLAAVHYLTVLDNSDILELGIGKQVVPFL